MKSASNSGRLIIISAPSGAGKTSLARALIERLDERGIRTRFSVSYTTRKPRPGERDGIDYHFVDQQTFDRMVSEGQFLEHARVFERCYGTGRRVTEELLGQGIHVFLDIDWQGARQVKAQMPEALNVFIQPPSLEELERRLRSRGQDDEAAIALRMEKAKDELSHADEYDRIIINDDFERALTELESLF